MRTGMIIVILFLKELSILEDFILAFNIFEIFAQIFEILCFKITYAYDTL
jgi:hypothetical protein